MLLAEPEFRVMWSGHMCPSRGGIGLGVACEIAKQESISSMTSFPLKVRLVLKPAVREAA